MGTGSEQDPVKPTVRPRTEPIRRGGQTPAASAHKRIRVTGPTALRAHGMEPERKVSRSNSEEGRKRRERAEEEGGPAS